MTAPDKPKRAKVPGSGRKKGSVNKKTLEMRDMARPVGEMALKTLVRLCKTGSSESIRFNAACALIDRGYGKAPQAVEHTGKDGAELEQYTNLELARRVAYLLTTGVDALDTDEKTPDTKH